MKTKNIIMLLIFILILLIPEVVEATGNSNFFSEDITWSTKYVQGGDVMPYALLSPSTANENESIPLIIYLHGDGEKGKSSNTLLNNVNGLPQVLQNSNLNGFNAYVLLPHLTGDWLHSSGWDNSSTRNDIKALLDKIIEEYNIDTDNIVISGGSRGGYGSIYIARELPQYFSKLVVISGYNNSYYTSITIPTRGYYGNSDDPNSINYMNGAFANKFGSDNVFKLTATHSTIIEATFTEDKDNNDCPDVVEWMFDGYESKTKSIEFFDEDITFEREYVSDGETMPYALYTPSTASGSTKLPLILWLHGLGEFNSSESTLLNSRFA